MICSFSLEFRKTIRNARQRKRKTACCRCVFSPPCRERPVTLSLPVLMPVARPLSAPRFIYFSRPPERRCMNSITMKERCSSTVVWPKYGNSSNYPDLSHVGLVSCGRELERQFSLRRARKWGTVGGHAKTLSCLRAANTISHLFHGPPPHVAPPTPTPPPPLTSTLHVCSLEVTLSHPTHPPQQTTQDQNGAGVGHNLRRQQPNRQRWQRVPLLLGPRDHGGDEEGRGEK